jgi:hypothetical protein
MNGASNNSNNNNGDTTGGGTSTSPVERDYRIKVEASLAQRFVKAMEGRMNELAELNRKKNMKMNEFKLSDHETKVLMDVCTSNILEGTLAGVVTFFVLRRVHAQYFKWVQRRYGLDTTTTSTTTSSSSSFNQLPTVPNRFNSPYQQIPNKPHVDSKTIRDSTLHTGSNSGSNRGTTGSGDTYSFGSPKWLYNVTSFLFDGIISFYVAVYVSTRNPEKFLQQVSDIPLMEGKSIVSNELCPILLQELQNIQNDIQQKQDNNTDHNHLHDDYENNEDMNIDIDSNSIKIKSMSSSSSSSSSSRIHANNHEIVQDAIIHPQTIVLKCLLNFCNNCQRRQKYESILREQNGLSDDEEVIIPFPGVPKVSSLFDTDDDDDGMNRSGTIGPRRISDNHNNSSTDWSDEDTFVTDDDTNEKDFPRRK